MQPGDVVVLPPQDGAYGVAKLLRIDPDPGGGETFHCVFYQPVWNVPVPEAVDGLNVLAWHAPIDGAAIRRDGRVLCNLPVTQEELFGFYEYLKQTHFERYAQETGQDLDTLLEAAKARYSEGCRLADERKFEEAVAEYSGAVEIFPQFTEAVDNRGLAHMDLGDLDSAVADFQHSLTIDSDNPTAFFSLGECYMKQGSLGEAEQIFYEGARRWPDQKHFSQFLTKARKRKGGKKPWWRFW